MMRAKKREGGREFWEDVREKKDRLRRAGMMATNLSFFQVEKN